MSVGANAVGAARSVRPAIGAHCRAASRHAEAARA